MSGRVEGRVALVTGAASGIGRGCAEKLAAEGAVAIVTDVQDEKGAETVAAIVGAGGKAEYFHHDVTDEAAWESVIAQVKASFGRLDILVNNAGIGIGGPLELIAPEDLRRQLDVNVLGQIAVTQAMLPALRRAHGRIVFLSSIGGRVAMAFTAPYAASKHAIEAIGDALRVELRTSGVQVALVEPGSVATPIWDKARAEGEQLTVPEDLQREYGHIPAAMNKALEDTVERGVPPEQVAQTIERALTARRMKARYLIGRDAKAMVFARRLLPDLVFDRLVRRALGV